MAVVITEQDIYTTASTWPRERLEALVEGLKNTLKSMKVVREEPTKKALQFPRIPKDLKMSQAVKDMVFWDFPKDDSLTILRIVCNVFLLRPKRLM